MKKIVKINITASLINSSLEYLTEVYQDVRVIVEQPVEKFTPFADKIIQLKERQIVVGQEYDPLRKISFRTYYVRDFGAVGSERFIEVGTRKYTQDEVSALRNEISPFKSLLGKFKFSN